MRAVGELLTVVGPCTLQRVKEPARKALTLDLIYAGDRLMVGPHGTTTVVLFHNAARFEVGAGTTVEITKVGLTGRSGAPPRALKSVSQVFWRPSNTSFPAAGLQRLGTIVRGGSDSQDPDDPTIGPRDLRPYGAMTHSTVKLTWKGFVSDVSSLANGSPVTLNLRIREAETEKDVFVTEVASSSHEAIVPEGTLHPGTWYLWTLTTVNTQGSGRKVGAPLRILTADESANLDDLKVLLAESERDEATKSTVDLLSAQMYERLGMFEAAEEKFQAVSKESPDDEGVALALKRLQKLLHPGTTTSTDAKPSQ
jgi:hypothetical protein